MSVLRLRKCVIFSLSTLSIWKTELFILYKLCLSSVQMTGFTLTSQMDSGFSPVVPTTSWECWMFTRGQKCILKTLAKKLGVLNTCKLCCCQWQTFFASTMESFDSYCLWIKVLKSQNSANYCECSRAHGVKQIRTRVSPSQENITPICLNVHELTVRVRLRSAL